MLARHGIQVFSQRLKQKLQITQNKMVRFILNLSPRSHVGHAELASLNYLNIENRVTFLRLCYVHKIFYERSPSYLRDHFIKTSQIHQYGTRGSLFNFGVPKIKSSAATTFYFSAIRDWNSLPDRIKGIETLQTFKRAIRGHLSNG